MNIESIIDSTNINNDSNINKLLNILKKLSCINVESYFKNDDVDFECYLILKKLSEASGRDDIQDLARKTLENSSYLCKSESLEILSFIKSVKNLASIKNSFYFDDCELIRGEAAIKCTYFEYMEDVFLTIKSRLEDINLIEEEKLRYIVTLILWKKNSLLDLIPYLSSCNYQNRSATANLIIFLIDELDELYKAKADIMKLIKNLEKLLTIHQDQATQSSFKNAVIELKKLFD